MTLNKSKYRFIKLLFFEFLEKRKDKKIHKLIRDFGIGNSIPILVLWLFYEEKYGKTEETTKNIESHMKFYDYDKIEE